MKRLGNLHFNIATISTENFFIPLVEFDLSHKSCEGCFFACCETKHLLTDDDGVTPFADMMIRAASIKVKRKHNLLFATGLTEEQVSSNPRIQITGEERLALLTAERRAFADPNLGWSLFLEEGQKTLRYLHDKYGLNWMDFLRRIIIDDGRRCAFSLFREGDGSWTWGICPLDCKRGTDSPALAFATF
ncbi:MAG: hypothetical protein WCQ00_04095 [bacterium]